MEKKKVKTFVIVSLIIVIVLFSVSAYFLLFFVPEPPEVPMFGPGTSDSSIISLEIIGQTAITIMSPLNISYFFNPSDQLFFNLNVSANFNAVNWRYTLYDMRHGGIEVYTDVAFPGTLNTSFDAVRWSNLLTVSADNLDVFGETITANVSFFVNVSNSAPYLGPINSSFFICEGSFFRNFFNATDVDEDVLTIEISPAIRFFIPPTPFAIVNFTTKTYEILSGRLGKTETGAHPLLVSIDDRYNNTCCVDTKAITINVIERNNPPVINPIRVQTVWTFGANASFYYQTHVLDVEDGNSTDGMLEFNISIINSSGDSINLFNITPTGFMNFSAGFSTPLGVYDISVCVNDTGILSPPPEILGVCGQTGESFTSCETFELTVTDKNRAPTIIDSFPLISPMTVYGGDALYFNITEFDPDGTTPDAYWYIDKVFLNYDSGYLVDNLTYLIPCSIQGEHIIKAEITDGLLNDSINWTLEIIPSACPPGERSGGGGGSNLISCSSKWGCQGWNVCQNAEISLEQGLLSGQNYREINDLCSLSFVESDSCGFQIRNCLDLENCTTGFNKPEEDQYCYYTENPSCEDGVENCHDGACELLVDCGGPCDPCPTCSDSIKNQNEGGIDCGGPCPWRCPEKISIFKTQWFLYGIIGLLFLLIILAAWKIIKIYRLKRERENPGS